jgi:hypothetical protein
MSCHSYAASSVPICRPNLSGEAEAEGPDKLCPRKILKSYSGISTFNLGVKDGQSIKQKVYLEAYFIFLLLLVGWD